MMDLTKTRATSAPTLAHGAIRRRSAGNAQDNALVWQAVYSACLAFIGETIETARGVSVKCARGHRIGVARAAAFKICNADYKMTKAEIGRLSGVSRQVVGRRLRQDRADVTDLVDRYRSTPEGSAHYCEITPAAAAAMSALGESKAVASAAILAARAVRHRSPAYGRRFTPQDDAEIARRTELGHTCAEIAFALDRVEGSIRQRRWRLKRKARGGPRAVQ